MYGRFWPTGRKGRRWSICAYSCGFCGWLTPAQELSWEQARWVERSNRRCGSCHVAHA